MQILLTKTIDCIINIGRNCCDVTHWFVLSDSCFPVSCLSELALEEICRSEGDDTDDMDTDTVSWLAAVTVSVSDQWADMRDDFLTVDWIFQTETRTEQRLCFLSNLSVMKWTTDYKLFCMLIIPFFLITEQEKETKNRMDLNVNRAAADWSVSLQEFVKIIVWH